MKNILIINGADNAAYSVYQATDEQFAAIFRLPNQDIIFSDELYSENMSEDEIDAIFNEIWTHPILKKDAMGIHGIILYDALHRKKHYPSSRRMIDMDWNAVNDYEWALNAKERSRLDRCTSDSD